MPLKGARKELSYSCIQTEASTKSAIVSSGIFELFAVINI